MEIFSSKTFLGDLDHLFIPKNFWKFFTLDLLLFWSQQSLIQINFKMYKNFWDGKNVIIAENTKNQKLNIWKKHQKQNIFENFKLELKKVYTWRGSWFSKQNPITCRNSYRKHFSGLRARLIRNQEKTIHLAPNHVSNVATLIATERNTMQKLFSFFF